MDWQKEIEELLARLVVADMIHFLNPWITEITDVSEEAEEALERLFKEVLETHDTWKAIWFAFCVGQAFEKAMLTCHLRNSQEKGADGEKD